MYVLKCFIKDIFVIQSSVFYKIAKTCAVPQKVTKFLANMLHLR